MTTITCAISGLKFKTDHVDEITIPHTAGYFHPIFAAEHKQLHNLYSLHCAAKLTATTSYLLMLAFLHSTNKISWKHPATISPNDPTTKILVENNLRQLVSVIAKSDNIFHPKFKQPDFVVNHSNADLRQIPFWIKAWEANIERFYTAKRTGVELHALAKLEEHLANLILSGEPTKSYAHIVADWAAVAGDFPADKKEEWKRVIRSCFNVNKMFNTPLYLIKEIKDHCECNLEIGSIYFHELYKVLKQGINCHVDYLGGSSLALGYQILPELTEGEALASIIKNEAAIKSITDNAPLTEPKKSDYDNSVDFLKARLAYSVAKRQAKSNNMADSTKTTNDKGPL